MCRESVDIPVKGAYTANIKASRVLRKGVHDHEPQQHDDDVHVHVQLASAVCACFPVRKTWRIRVACSRAPKQFGALLFVYLCTDFD